MLHKKFFIISVFCMLSAISNNTFAEPMSYDSYVAESREACDNPQMPWNQTSHIIRKINYPKLDPVSIEKWITFERSSTEDKPPALREAILNNLDSTRL